MTILKYGLWMINHFLVYVHLSFKKIPLLINKGKKSNIVNIKSFNLKFTLIEIFLPMNCKIFFSKKMLAICKLLVYFPCGAQGLV